MTVDRRAEVLLPTILDELSRGPYPEYVEDILQMTARTRQRPAWTFGQVWLGRLGVGGMALPARGMRWRLVMVATLIAALLLATAFILTAGSRRPVPPPFGLARNGLVVLERSGDIVTVDPATGVESVLVGGSTWDVGPRVSPDGTRVLFERAREKGRSEIWTVGAWDGAMTLLTPQPVVLARGDIARGWERYTMAPDGRTVAIAISGRRGPGIAIAQADGSSVRELDLGMAATEPSFRPPDGRELLFVGRGRTDKGIFAVDLETFVVRTIVKVSPPRDLAGASWSPDGSRIAYWRWSNAADAEGMNARVRIVRADGSGDRLIPSPPGSVWSAHATWSNDGTRLFVVHGYSAGFDDVRGYVLPADLTSAGDEVAPAGFAEKECCAAWIWSPDDTRILGRPGPYGERQVIIDVAARTARVAPWTAAGDPTWQRLAP